VPSTIQLSGPQIGKFSEVLRDAFAPATFELMILHRLNRRVYNLAPAGASFETTVSAVIDRANMEGWLDQLILKAREANPGNPKLITFAQQFELAVVPIEQKEPGDFTAIVPLTTRQEVERVVKPQNPFLDVNVWRQQLGEIESRVCCIEFETDQGDVINGTGFLFGGPDVVMTNYHVMEAVIKGENKEKTAEGHSAKAKNVQCRFDLKRTSNGTVLNPGVTFKLADDWLIDQSPNYPLDQLPPNDHLDYALIRLASPAGDDTVGQKNNQAGEKRGYISLPSAHFNPAKGSGLSIMQHPQGLPLKLVLDSDGVMGLNENATRLRYKTNTEKGSSGSPCFTFKWELVALHHSGDPDFDPAHKPTYNEGIPMTAIWQLIKQRGIESKLVKQSDD
jgi:hypothetical protein